MTSSQDGSEDEVPFDHDRARAERIQRNNAMLAQLQLKQLAADVVEESPAVVAAREKKARQEARKAKHRNTGPVRRSSRAGVAATTERLKAQHTTSEGSSSDEQQSSDAEEAGDHPVDTARSREEADFSPEEATQQRMQTDASGSDSASSLEDADSEGKDDTAMAQERPVKRKAAEAGASADLHPGKRKHKRKHKSSRHQGHRAGSAAAGNQPPAFEGLDDEDDVALQQALAESMLVAPRSQQPLKQEAANMMGAKPAAPVDLTEEAALGPPGNPPPGPQSGPQPPAGSGPAPAAAGKGSGARAARGKGGSKQKARQMPTSAEMEAAFRQFRPHGTGRITPQDVVRVSNTTLDEYLTNEELDNIMDHGHAWAGCSEGCSGLDKSSFIKLVQHFYAPS